MKKTIVCAFLLAVAIQSINAQGIPERKRGRTHNLKHHDSFKELNLSEDQRSKFKDLNADFHKQMQELKKNDNITVKEWREKMGTLRKDHRSQMQSILTTEQKAMLEKSKEERKGRNKERAEGRFQRMETQLGLTTEQTARLKENRSAISAKMKAIREDKSLDEAQKKEQQKELWKKQKDEFRSILTDEQLKKLHEKQTRRQAKQSA
jgi:Spy/CpxP family protein refolding chaperone